MTTNSDIQFENAGYFTQRTPVVDFLRYFEPTIITDEAEDDFRSQRRLAIASQLTGVLEWAIRRPAELSTLTAGIDIGFQKCREDRRRIKNGSVWIRSNDYISDTPPHGDVNTDAAYNSHKLNAYPGFALMYAGTSGYYARQVPFRYWLIPQAPDAELGDRGVIEIRTVKKGVDTICINDKDLISRADIESTLNMTAMFLQANMDTSVGSSSILSRFFKNK